MWQAEPNTIKLVCDIPSNEYTRLASWQEDSDKYIRNYIETEVHKDTIDGRFWDKFIAFIDEDTRFNNCHFFKSKDEKVYLISSSLETLVTIIKVAQDLDNMDMVSESFSLPEDKYKVLVVENKIDFLRNEYPNTTFSPDRIRGPKQEIVGKAVKAILDLGLKVSRVTLPVTETQAMVLGTENGKLQMSKLLRSKDLTDDFEIFKEQLTVSVFVENDFERKKKQEVILSCVESAVKIKEVDVKNEVTKMYGEDWTDVKSKLGSVFIEEEYAKKRVILSGTPEMVDEAERKMAEFFKEVENRPQAQIASISLLPFIVLIIEDREVEICRDSRDRYTGTVKFLGNSSKAAHSKIDFKKILDKATVKWYSLSRPWLAKAVDDLPNYKEPLSIVRADIADTLAVNKVHSAGIFSGQGCVVFTKVCDVTLEVVDVIVAPVDEELSFHTGVSRAVISRGICSFYIHV